MQTQQGGINNRISRESETGIEKKMNMGSLNLSLDEEGKEGKSKVLCKSSWMMKDIKKFCLGEGLVLTCSAEYLVDDVRVIKWTMGQVEAENRQ